MQANEAIRNRLDRKSRVAEIRARNDEQLAYSIHHVANSRSPVRGAGPGRSPVRTVVEERKYGP